MKKISVVILNWNGEAMLRQFLPSVIAYSEAEGVEVCVADNASSDASCDVVRKEFPAVRLIELEENYGFAEGYNRALQQVDAPFAFSALPNTAQEIEAAQHITELPAIGRTSVMVLGAVRGVGGIDSWGTDVEEPYHVSGEEDHSVSFRIVL